MELEIRDTNSSGPEAPGYEESREDVTHFVASFTLIIATIAVLSRVYTRKFLINQLGVDDYCAIVAWVSLD